MNVYFGLGTNLGARLANLRQAVERLHSYGFVPISKSNVFETEPWGVLDQPYFLNACVKAEVPFKDAIETDILQTVKKIEAEMGRTASVRWGARLIDIDILIIDDLSYKYESEILTIPHKEMANRAFVLYPLVQIFPNSTIEQLSQKFPRPTRITAL